VRFEQVGKDGRIDAAAGPARDPDIAGVVGPVVETKPAEAARRRSVLRRALSDMPEIASPMPQAGS
jgi:hypothetical protein